jgi:hypothetical protein
MSERQRINVIDQLRARFGYHYPSAMEEGRAELVRTISDEVNCSNDEADTLFQHMIDVGEIRYVPAIERDPVGNPAVAPADQPDPETDNLAKDVRVNAIPGQGGPPGGTSGMTGGQAAPAIVGGGTTTSPTMPVGAGLAASTAEGTSGRPDLGYWDLGYGSTGVAPSATRKGQVKPRGT